MNRCNKRCPLYGKCTKTSKRLKQNILRRLVESIKDWLQI